MSRGSLIKGYVELMRPGNAIAASILTLIGAFVAGGALKHQIPAIAAMLATLLATAAGNAINDYFDRDIDRVNSPDRPIPRGAVSPRGALWFSIALFIIAISLTFLLPTLAILIAAINLIALIAYTEIFKGMPAIGNGVVAYLGGSTFLFGGAAVTSLDESVLTLFILAALATFSREVIKDVEDMAGDATRDLRTLPLVAGERVALGIASLSLALAILASPAPYISEALGWPYLILVVPADVTMAIAMYCAWQNATLGQRVLKFGTYLAAVAFVVGRIAAEMPGLW
ncbi:MAG: geranylgeranylglycerol-phosphate geranylgeranyltransferase [Halobacteriaceae archaeon]